MADTTNNYNLPYPEKSDKANPDGDIKNLAEAVDISLKGLSDTKANDNEVVKLTEKGSNDGVAELDGSGKVPSTQLPSYVDDVLEYADLASFPVTGETGKIYVAIDTNLTYRWTGSVYVEISQSLALGETSSTAYRGDRGAEVYNNAVRKSGSESIDGVKTFTSIPVAPASDPTTGNQLARKAYVDAKTRQHSCTIFKDSDQNVTAEGGLDILTFTSGGVQQVNSLINKIGNSSIRCDAGIGLIRIRVHIVVDPHAADQIMYAYIRNSDNDIIFCEIVSTGVGSFPLTISAVSPVIDIHSGLSESERTFHVAIGKGGAGTLVAKARQGSEAYGTFMEIERLGQ